MLTVYRASAGSGKTYRLTLEYLKLLFSAKEREAYRHILAVTFTNKATGEMKRRIIQELFVLAHGVRSSDYFKELASFTGFNESDLQGKAKEILFSLLHDFSSFSIDTIDRFFQQTTRAFTREIGLQGGYNLEIDNSRVLSEAVDRMLFELEDSSSKELLSWLLKFSEEKVENAESWNIRKDIEALSGEIFKETYKTYSRELLALTADKKVLKEYISELAKIRNMFESFLQELGEEGQRLLFRFQLQAADFKGGKNSPFSHFEKWASGIIKEPTATFAKLAGDIAQWYTKTTAPEIRARIEEAYNGGLNDCIEKVLKCFELYPRYLSVVETSRYFYTLGILSDIDRNVRAYEQEHNLLLLSDTTELLNRVIDGSDTPFVYEKIGTRIDNLMIDEFQDTSNMQWANFSPLFKDSLDRGKNSLIVGDVKQSIYRWRNSDWKLLHDRLKQSFGAGQMADNVLDTNWRSSSQVIAFNNVVFQMSSRVLQDILNDHMADAPVSDDEVKDFKNKIVDAYSDTYQHVSPKNKDYMGHVSIFFKDTADEIPWRERALEDIPDVLKRLQDQGLRLKDIAFLVRYKRDGRLIADKLLSYKAQNTDSRYRFDIISDEALYLGNAPVIKLIISILNYLQNPDSEINRTQAVYEYEIFHEHQAPSDALSTYFSLREDVNDLTFFARIESLFEDLRTRPLFEMCEKIIEYFPPVNKSDEVYVQAFQDVVLSYIDKHSADLASFLQWWDEKGKSKTILTPDSQDAIRIMTIHQSKGLEFKAVIMPFCDWSLDNNDSQHANILWCRPRSAPFDRLPLVPVRYSSRLEKTIYAYDYFNEEMHSYIDNLNLAYVAFTRAKEELVLIAPKPKSGNTISSVSSLLYYCVSNSFSDGTGREFVDLRSFYNPDTCVFEFGKATHTVSEQPSVVEEIAMPEYLSIDFKNRLRLRLQGKGYFGDREERRYGTLMHEILSTIHYPEDLSQALKPYIFSGQLTREEAAEVEGHIQKWISSPEVSRWFAPGIQVLNEAEILQSEGIFYRPDRVVIAGNEVSVIDYKFGMAERDSYRRQVRQYVSLVEKMGYNHVSGYIWYVELSKIEKV